jgi:hypothetical protein
LFGIGQSIYDPYRSDPRFQAFASMYGAEEYYRRTDCPQDLLRCIGFPES